jgi:putative aldouronate transport system permease protein
VLSLLNIAISFPFPIVLALLLNQLRLGLFKRFSQTVYYAPFFLSKVVLVGMIFIFFSPRSGLVNQVLELIGFEPIFFMGEERWFRPLFVASGVWQETGWKSIIFLGALTAVSPELHESAIIDGASRFKRILYIDLPSILPTIMIILILSVGRMMTIEFDKTYLMQTPLNLGVSEVIQTFVYKRGLIEARYSFATAVGLFNSVVNFAILLVVNRVAGKLSEVSLW